MSLNYVDSYSYYLPIEKSDQCFKTMKELSDEICRKASSRRSLIMEAYFFILFTFDGFINLIIFLNFANISINTYL